jgi:Cu(I)/Ag(I) efflux system membrane fusion protein
MTESGLTENNKKSKMKVANKAFVSGSFFILTLLAFLSCNMHTEKTDTAPEPSDGGLRLSESQIQLANINVAEVNQGTLGINLLLTGVLKVNELSAVSISSRAAGRIEKLYFKTTGEKVNIGDSLYTFYAEEMVSAEREYFNIQRNNWNTTGQYPPSLLLEDRLLFLGMVPAQIAQLRKDGKILFEITIISQVNGIIRSINIAEGQYVEAGEKLFELATDNTIWVEAESYPDELGLIREGTPATVIIPSMNNMPITTRISYINPFFDPGRNVTRVRSVINNQDKELHPGMLALISIQSQRAEGIVIPVSAVIMEKGGSKVWVRDGSGAFFGRKVTTGIQSADSIIVLSGLEQSEMVVTSGAYLLNSEMILNQQTITGGETEL